MAIFKNKIEHVQIDDHVLINGDCTNVLKNMNDKTVDLVLIDPPYELDNHGGGKTELAQRKLVKDKHIDYISNGFDLEEVFTEVERVCKPLNLLCFCSNKQVSKIMKYWEDRKYSTTLLMWQKTNPSPLCNLKHLSDVEFVVYVRGRGATFINDTPFDYKRKVTQLPITSNKNRLHPTQKPIELLKQYIELHSNENDIVLDFFMGSNSTGIACKELNRSYIGVEIDKKMFNKAVKRYED